MRNIIIVLVILILLGGGVWYFARDNTADPNGQMATTTATSTASGREYEVIGRSVEGREIQAYHFGEGENKLVLVGAIHGGYEWNSALLAYELIDYFKENPSEIPNGTKVTIIPVANPDGLAAVVGTSSRFAAADAPQFDFADEVKFSDPVVAARFNKDGVDLNRNFACQWQAQAVWRDYQVKAGTSAFSEPEARVLRDFFLREKLAGVIFYHSASNGAFTSFCGEADPLAGTASLLSTYATASGYPRYDDYPYYEVTGDAADWLSTQGIPAITVELSTHESIDWARNLAGVKAVLAR
jgi:predicted deacylase